MDRRRFLELATVSGLPALHPRALDAQANNPVVNDISQLNPVRVAQVRRPRSTDEVAAALRTSSGAVSVGGGRYSMGGQIAAAGSLHLDMRAMNRIVSLDAARRVIRVQAGATWRDIQEVIDPHDLSVKIMQSYCNFTVGGSVSVNCHGRYVGKGPLVNSVRAVQLVGAAGEVLELTRARESGLFGAVFGGYGGLGVITEVELELDANVRIERRVEDVALDRYLAYFRDRVLADERTVLHNADLTPPAFTAPRAISWITTEQPLTTTDRLIPRNLDYSFEKNAIWAITELPGGNLLRKSIAEQELLQRRAVVWRNHEASLDVASLEPRTRSMSTYLLQEYFIPGANFEPFARAMVRILKARHVNALNVSIRHSPEDTVSLLKWAPTEVFCFVLYYKQRNNEEENWTTGVWTRELVDAALVNGGRYYLPYRLDATRPQFEQAYPEFRAFAELKARIDPGHRFRNLLWDKYLPAV
ncbi:MAG: FAD-binding oxidoreductase [Gammaproteobacteria bacterium]